MVMVQRTTMMVINRQPVIKWCLTDTSALWDSSQAVRQYWGRPPDWEQAHYPSMHREGGGESAKLSPAADKLLNLRLHPKWKLPDCDCFHSRYCERWSTTFVINVL